MFTHPNTTTTMITRSVASESREYIADSTTVFSEASRSGPVAILWDIENCPVPASVRPEDVAGNIRAAVRLHPVTTGGAVKSLSAYGDFNMFPKRLREGCQRTGVRLVDVPGGRKDSADKAILVDMFLFALDNPPPSSIVLISGDVDFSPALHVLGQRGYTVVLALPGGARVSPALRNAGDSVWDWPSVARGDGFLPPPAISRGQEDGNVPDLWVRPGDLDGLKSQVFRLLEASGGGLYLNQLPSEYCKAFARPLFVEEYGEAKLVDLLEKMGDPVAVQGKGKKMFVYARSSTPPPAVVLLRRGDGDGGDGDASAVVRRMMMGRGCGYDAMLEQFRHELQEILVSYSCQIFVGHFEELYQQRYKKPVDYRIYGVDRLEDLLEKVGDVVAVHQEPGSQKKFLSTLGG